MIGIKKVQLAILLSFLVVKAELLPPITGRIVDERGFGIAGVEIQAGANSAISETDGRFELSQLSSNNKFFDRGSNSNKHSIVNGNLVVNLVQNSYVGIDFYSLAGKKVGSYSRELFKGISNVNISPLLKTLKNQSVILKVSEKNTVSTFLLLRSNSPTTTSSASFQNHTLSKQASIPVDGHIDSTTLVCAKKGYLTRTIKILSNYPAGEIRMFDTTLVWTKAKHPSPDGSTTMIPLTTMIACKAMNVPYEWVRPTDWMELWKVKPKNTVVDSIQNSIAQITTFSKTHNAYDSLILGKRDFILVARVPSNDETAFAYEKNFEFDIREFARDAFIFIVNNDNIHPSLTIKNVKDIFTKSVTQWQEIGSSIQGEIRPYQREQNSGSQELMISMVMKTTPIPSSIPVLYGMERPYEFLERDDNALSFTVYYYNKMQIRPNTIKPIAIENVFPNDSTITNGTYPLISPVYIVTRKNLSDTTQAFKFREWLLSSYGQKVVKESGYCPIVK